MVLFFVVRSIFVLVLGVLCIFSQDFRKGSQFEKLVECQVGGTLKHGHLMRGGDVGLCCEISFLQKRKVLLFASGICSGNWRFAHQAAKSLAASCCLHPTR